MIALSLGGAAGSVVSVVVVRGTVGRGGLVAIRFVHCSRISRVRLSSGTKLEILFFFFTFFTNGLYTVRPNHHDINFDRLVDISILEVVGAA